MRVVVTLILILVAVAASGAGLWYARSERLSLRSVFVPVRTRPFVLRERGSDEVLGYRLFEPRGADETSGFPLVVVLHSAYERGDNNLSQLTPAVRLMTSRAYQKVQKAYIVAPQAPAGLEWNDLPPIPPPYVNYDMSSIDVSWRQDAIAQLVAELLDRYPIDPDRVSITGNSMGATGTWDTIYRYPRLFAAAVPLNGRTDPAVADTVAHIPIRMFHGEHDEVGPLSNSTSMEKALREAGADVELTVLDAGHGIADLSWSSDLYAWITSQRRAGTN